MRLPRVNPFCRSPSMPFPYVVSLIVVYGLQASLYATEVTNRPVRVGISPVSFTFTDQPRPALTHIVRYLLSFYHFYHLDSVVLSFLGPAG